MVAQRTIGMMDNTNQETPTGFYNRGSGMPQSLVQVYFHIVFSTKNRTPFLSDPEFRNHTHRYLAGTCKNLKCPALKIGGTVDHVHILCCLGKTNDISYLIRDLKRDSSKWIKDELRELATFYWQRGYGAFHRSFSWVRERLFFP